MDIDYIIHKLWTDYLVWIRDYIYVAMQRQEGMQYVQERLTRFITEFADFFKTFYGEQVAEQYGDLLKRHIDLISQYTTIVHANESPAPLRDDLYANADDIAKFLASINPNWNETMWQKLLRTQTYLEEKLIWAIRSKGYGEAMAQYDEIYANIHKIIDYLINGIQKQFGSA